MVSAGNSGAMMACGLFVLGRLPGVERPAIVHHLPDARRASARCSTWARTSIPSRRVLAQFAVLGSVYARLLHGKARPAVGLLSNGSEDHKGTPLTRDAHQLLTRPTRRRGRLRATSATSKGATSSGARSTSSSPTGSPATSCSRASEGAAAVILDMVREEVARSGSLAKLGAALMTGALKRLAAHRLRRARRRAAARRRGRRADLPRRLERDGDEERRSRRRSIRADGPAQGADGGRGAAHMRCGTGRRRRRRGGRLVMRSRILGTGRAVPAKVLTNDDLAQDGRHVRRLDRRAHRDPRAPHPRAVAGGQRSGRRGRAARPASAAGVDPAERRLHHRRHGDAPTARCRPPPPSCRRRWARARWLRVRYVGGVRRVPLRPVDRRRASSDAGSSSACSSSASRCSRASSTGPIATPACCSATAPARRCSMRGRRRGRPRLLSTHMFADGRRPTCSDIPAGGSREPLTAENARDSGTS